MVWACLDYKMCLPMFTLFLAQMSWHLPLTISLCPRRLQVVSCHGTSYVLASHACVVEYHMPVCIATHFR